eukprot:Em0009g984a
MRVTMAFEKEPDFQLDSKQFKAIIVHSLQTLHGQVGAAVPVDILQCHSQSASTLTSIIRIPYHELVKVWSALTLLGTYNGFVCIIKVERASPSLLSLALSSRAFDFSRRTLSTS